MTKLIAVSGKGGAGKTAVAAGLVLCLADELREPVLAVDADPNSTLGEALGLEYTTTLAHVREQKQYPGGIPKVDIVALRLEDALVEGQGVDLLVMGRPEGPGCYCAANHLLRSTLRRIAQRYPAVVVDNEAGMEHLSRRTTDDVAALLIVAGPTVVSLRAAQRVLDLANEQHLSVGRTVVVLNRWPESPPQNLTQAAAAIAADRHVYLPHSDGIERLYRTGESFRSLDTTNTFLRDLKRNLVPLMLEIIRGGASREN